MNRVQVISTHVTVEDERIQKLRQVKKRKQTASPSAQRQHNEGKLLVRERIKRLLDSDRKFFEFGTLVNPNNCVAGIGYINGMQVVVAADDFTSRGSHADGGPWMKQVQAEETSLSLGIPMIRLLDGASGGGSVNLILKTGFAYVPPLPGFRTMTEMLSHVPVVAVALGPVVGLGGAKSQMTHYTVLCRKIGQIFTAGPPVVNSVFQTKVTKEQLGGHEVISETGEVDEVCDSEDECFERVQSFLSYLPKNSNSLPWPVDDEVLDPTHRAEEELQSIIPKQPSVAYDMRRIIELVVDVGTFFEIGSCWGKEIIVGFARMAGFSIGIVAQDCVHSGGALTSASSQKLRRFVDLCSTFHLPVLSFVDMPGMAIGVEAEKAGTLRHGTNAIVSMYHSKSPWFNVIVRRCYGVGGAAFVDHSQPHFRIAWPSGDWGSLPVGGGVSAAFKNVDETKRDAQYKKILELVDPIRSAQHYAVEEIVEPKYTRRIVCEWVQMVYDKMRGELGKTTSKPVSYRP